MAHIPFYDYRIGVGSNVALGSLTNVELLTAGGRYFFGPQAYGFHSPGTRKPRLTGMGYRAGYESVTWRFVMTRPQYEYLSTTYCGGTLEGQVTIYSRLGTSAYVRANAVMSLPATSETDSAWVLFRQIDIHMSHVVRI